MDGVRLRRTRPEDLSFVLATERALSHSPVITQWSPQEHAASMSDPDRRHWIIEGPDGRPLGYLIALGLTNPAREIHLKRIVVSGPGRGVGRQALRLFHREAFGSLGALRVSLAVHPQNPRAERLYRSEGYARTGQVTPNGFFLMALGRPGT